MQQSKFFKGLRNAEMRLRRAEKELERTKHLATTGDMTGAFGTAFAFEAEVEKLVLLARTLPAHTGHPHARELSDQLMLHAIPVEMGYAASGWFCLKIPALLPKKESGSPVYIQEYLYPAMRLFFQGKPPTLYQRCVMAFRNIYSKDRPERSYRDHDNIEYNMVADIVALYLLPDDAPRWCSHFYCSAAGTEDQTEVYIIPHDLFPDWLEEERNDRLKEEPLYETPPIWPPKDK